MINLRVFLVGLVLLVYLSFLDVKHREIENHLLIFIFVMGSLTTIFTNQYHLFALSGAYLLAGLILWKLKSLGGADAKLFPSIPFFLFNGLDIYQSYRFSMIFLMVIWMISLGYVILLKLNQKKIKNKKNKKDEVPFIPIIALAYFFTGIVLS